MKVVRFAHLFLAVTALMWGISSGGFAADSTGSPQADSTLSTRSLLRPDLSESRDYGGPASSPQADELRAETVAGEQYAWLVSAEAEAEQALDRAVLEFESSLIDGDVLTVASPLLRAFKLGGRWENLAAGEDAPDWLARRTAFYLSPGEVGALCLILNRDVLGDAELELQIEYFDGTGSLFGVALVDESERVIASSADYMEGTGEVVVKALEIPLRLYPETRGVYLRGEGGAEDGLFVLGVALFVNRASAGNVSQVPDDNASGRGGGVAVVRENRQPEVPDDNVSRRATSPAPPQRKSGRKSIPPALRAKPVSAKSIPQFVRSLMADTYFQVTRDVLSAGGGFRSSPLFILEDTLGQSSAIGFSSDGAFRLQAGYQQAEAEPIVFRNVSVLPEPFQAQLRRFNPGLGETANFSYVLSTEAREVTVNVLDPNDVVIRTLVAQARQNRGLHAVAWDGRDANGNLVTANRRYTFTLSAVNYDGVTANYVPANDNEVRIAVSNNIAVISAVSDQPDPFIPAAGDSRISYTTTAPIGVDDLNMTVEIFTNNLTMAPARRWDFNNQLLGAHSVDWDGADNSGQPVPDGFYTYVVRQRGGLPGRANPQWGAIRLVRQNTVETQSADGLVALRHAGQAAITITPVSPGAVGGALYAIRTADPSLILQSLIYQVTPSATAFTPPALMTFRYSPTIIGNIDAKLEIRRFNQTTLVWEPVARQFVDWVNNQVVAEIDTLSLYALFAVERPPLPPVLAASVRLEPEVLKVTPGVLTAFVRLPEDYPASGIISATCDGAQPERMMPNDDGTAMIIKFRRQAIEEALAEQGEPLDTHFVVEGTWQGPEGIIPFAGEDDIAKIL